MLHKSYFDKLIAEELGISARKVGSITSAFLSKVLEAIVDGDIVTLEAFGRFFLKESKLVGRSARILTAKPVKGHKARHKTDEVYRVERLLRVHFKKSETFNKRLQAKYGPSGRREKK